MATDIQRPTAFVEVVAVEVDGVVQLVAPPKSADQLYLEGQRAKLAQSIPALALLEAAGAR